MFLSAHRQQDDMFDGAVQHQNKELREICEPRLVSVNLPA